MEISTEIVDPFLKWAGGKRWLVRSKNPILPDSYSRYIEPFVGSGAVFFSLNKKPFVLADANAELINCYNAIRNDYEDVERHLKIHERNHNKEYYYKVRASKPIYSYTRAAKFIYLNRTCWNGLYRVNLNGKFNVPIGTKDKVFLETDDFPKVSKLLKKGEIIHQDFEKTIALANDGDFIFIDPPYTVKHNMNGFVKYNEKIFSWEDQKRLKKSIFEAVDRGAMITLTNADHECIHELYGDLGEMETISRSSVIAGSAKHRGSTTELIIRFGWSRKTY